MALPSFNASGDLPEGVHIATLKEVLARFGAGMTQRVLVGSRLKKIYKVAAATGQLRRFIVYGSFITAKPEPRDVDVLILMQDSFDAGSVDGEAVLLFQHMTADAHFGASVFWLRRASALGGEEAMVEFWQGRREGGKRGIVEIIAEENNDSR